MEITPVVISVAGRQLPGKLWRAYYRGYVPYDRGEEAYTFEHFPSVSEGAKIRSAMVLVGAMVPALDGARVFVIPPERSQALCATRWWVQAPDATQPTSVEFATMLKMARAKKIAYAYPQSAKNPRWIPIAELGISA